MTDKEIIRDLIARYGDQIIPINVLPKAYCPRGISNVKAIYLGCDPSNVHSTELPYAFAHESGLNVFNSFLESHCEQLKQVGLGWDSVYTQNLCRNYFKEETGNNKLWKTIATDFWIEKLKEELLPFKHNIPVLLTSAYLYNVLVSGKKHKPKEYYLCEQPIPISPENNKLERPLIPFYRNRRKIDYHLTNQKWQSYKNRIVEILKSE